MSRRQEQQQAGILVLTGKWRGLGLPGPYNKKMCICVHEHSLEKEGGGGSKIIGT